MSLPAAHRNRNRLSQDPLHAIPIDHIRGELRGFLTVDLDGADPSTSSQTGRRNRNQSGCSAQAELSPSRLAGDHLAHGRRNRFRPRRCQLGRADWDPDSVRRFILTCYATPPAALIPAPSSPDRTASALATKLLADPASQVLVIFGSGVQAYHHARAFAPLSLQRVNELSAEVFSRAGLILELFPSITQVKLVVRSRSARASTLANNIATLFPRVTITLEISEEEAVAAAVETADIICTCVSLLISSPAFCSTVSQNVPDMSSFSAACRRRRPSSKLKVSSPACTSTRVSQFPAAEKLAQGGLAASTEPLNLSRREQSARIPLPCLSSRPT